MDILKVKQNGEWVGIPAIKGDKGEKGDTGEQGQKGADGFSPTASVSKSGSTATITITDKNGTTSATVSDGAALIDDTAGTGDTDKAWSANKTASELGNVFGAINQKYTKPVTGIPASDLAAGVIPAVPVQDVQVNGTSILSQGVANVPVATANQEGVVRPREAYGINIAGPSSSQPNALFISKASSANVKAGADNYRSIVPYNQHESTFYGLAKLAGADMASVSGATVGVYPEAQKIAIQKMLGIYEAPWELIREDTFTFATQGNHTITTDANGNPFQLTDVIILFETPVQDTASSMQTYGQMYFYEGSTMRVGTISEAWTQAANGAAHGIMATIEQDGSLIKWDCTMPTTSTNISTVRRRYNAGFSGSYQSIKYITEPIYIDKITIGAVTGTGHYVLIGKRKWT